MPDISRRSFVGLTTGMHASLPVLAGGLVLAPRSACAQDDAAAGGRGGALGAGIAAAGAAMIAYSRRRASIEEQLRKQGVDLDDEG